MYIHVGACVLRMFQDHERMDLLNKTGFFDDSIITSNSLYYGEIYSVPRAIYGYYERPGSIMTSMNIIDTALHNCQGCDLDIQVVRPENREDIFQRYAYAIIRVYLYKKSIYKYIGNERYEMYLNECKKIDNSLTYKIINLLRSR